MYNKVNQLYIYIYPLFFRFFSHIGHYRVLCFGVPSVCVSLVLLNRFQGSRLFSVQVRKTKDHITHNDCKIQKDSEVFCVPDFLEREDL